ncbi:peptidoglycan DD-metalloendopeptidase family protein [Thiopseudomonas acetoxidans]|uniref:Peptidoglycan DD-metalloendopeptidase family protein n=1 Tax=Thiopseudomonas acetoxidans TaxID=3041622 RepID=A0ABT7SRI3_9GAMM|nr:peptidoglycan DD-metalloendopeptidase family protein [Thiopseudomonas sp. CY1220]MDM7858806.1 peptidoglycan DD-metalloendopeptidase family protein [Thiopseudomonas sp. CY1220]
MTTEHISTEPTGELSYPKNRLLAASGITALLCFTLMVYPSRQVEAKKTFLDVSSEEVSYIDQQTEFFDGIDTDTEFAGIEDTYSLEDEPTDEPLTPTAEVDQDTQQIVVVKSGDTLSSIFSNVGLSNAVLMGILEQDPKAKRFTNLKINQKLVFTFNPDRTLKELASDISPLKSIHITQAAASDTYSFSEQVKQTSTEHKVVSGTISQTLLGATKEAGLPYKLTLDLANIFGYDIDFAQDLRKGDNFSVVYEQKKIDDKVVSSGNILAAQFTNRGKTYTAVRYTNKQGYTSYYDDKGSSTQKAFIRTPVDFSRISSRFNLGRKHPVLNTIRAHKGVDYAAPIGTPVKATGDGKIIVAGRRGGYGNTVIIQHGNKYRTVYAHLRGFAKGIRSGSQVKQGQVIAYVGTTGLSTGPHLHYEFQVNGAHVDPLSHTLPAADPIPKNELARFKQQAAPHLAMLEQSNAQIAMADKE